MSFLAFPRCKTLGVSPYLLVSCLVAGCLPETNQTPDATSDHQVETEEVEVSSEGGTVEIEAAELTFPAGARTDSITIEVTEVTQTVIQEIEVLLPEGATFAEEPVAFLPHGTEFEEPVEVVLRYTGETPGGVVTLSDENDTTWEEVPNVTYEDGEARFQVDHFSFFALLDTPALDVGGDGDATGDGDSTGDGDATGDGDGDATGDGDGDATGDGDLGGDGDSTGDGDLGGDGDGGDGDSTVACQAPLTDCSGQCVDFYDDTDNCGGCGVACSEGEVCSFGQCEFLGGTGGTGTGGTGTGGEPASGGSGSEECQEGMLMCEEGCVDWMYDNGNCGGCGIQCAEGQESCYIGECTPILF